MKDKLTANWSARTRAAMRGDIKFDGSRCGRCGGVTKYTLSSTCVECHKGSARKSAAKRRQALREMMMKAGSAR